MSRRARTLVLVVVAILAFGSLAATIGSVDPDAEPAEPGEVNESLDLPDSPEAEPGEGTTLQCPGPLTDGQTLAGLLAAVGVGGAALYRRFGSPALSAVVAAPLALGAFALCPPSGLPAVDAPATGVPTELLVGALVLAIGGAVGFLWINTGARGGLDVGDADGEVPDLNEVSAAAGEAADRIERQADASNEVYRAWREMARHLHVPNPEATTPDEFREHAVAAGLDADAVDELTDVFRDVRYGELDPDRREDRAVAALRRIERAGDDENGNEGAEDAEGSE